MGRKKKPNTLGLESVAATDAKNRFGEVLHRICYWKKKLLIERNGTPMAVILSLDEYERLCRKAGEWPERPDAAPAKGA